MNTRILRTEYVKGAASRHMGGAWEYQPLHSAYVSSDHNVMCS
jgi:hypothetical protein